MTRTDLVLEPLPYLAADHNMSFKVNSTWHHYAYLSASSLCPSYATLRKQEHSHLLAPQSEVPCSPKGDRGKGYKRALYSIPGCVISFPLPTNTPRWFTETLRLRRITRSRLTTSLPAPCQRPARTPSPILNRTLTPWMTSPSPKPTLSLRRRRTTAISFSWTIPSP